MKKRIEKNEESELPTEPQSELTGLPSLTVEEVLKKEIIKLDLGGGNHPAEGYINVDIQYYAGVDLILDVTKLDEHFPPKSVDGIMCRDTLQCFPATQTKGVLKKWFSILKPKSRLVIQCFDIRQISEQFLKGEIDMNRLRSFLYGKFDNANTIYHNCFDEEYLVNLLQSIGFVVQEVTRPTARIKIVATKVK